MLVIRHVSDQSYYIVDESVPGGEDLEHQTTQARAKAALARWQAKRGEGLRLVSDVAAGEATATPARLDVLAEMLKGKAGEVRGRMALVASAADLQTLAELEEAVLGRTTVLRAIRQRLEAVA